MRSSVPVESKSKQLAEYATDLLQAPPQDLRAALTFVIPAVARLQQPQVPASAATVAPAVPEAQTPRSLLTDRHSSSVKSGNDLSLSADCHRSRGFSCP